MQITVTGATFKENQRGKWVVVTYNNDKGEAKEKHIFPETQNGKRQQVKVQGFDWLASATEKGELNGKQLDLTVEQVDKYWNVLGVKEVGSAKSTANAVNDDIKSRSMCISYAKDLACAKMIELQDMAEWADYFLGYVLGGVCPPASPSQPITAPSKPTNMPREAPQSKSAPLAQETNSKTLEQEAVELGGQVIPSVNEVLERIAKLKEKNPALTELVFINMMEKRQPGIKERVGIKNGNKTIYKFSDALGALTDENKVKFWKAL